MVDQKSSTQMSLPQILLAIGMFAMVLAAMIGAVAQGTAAPRYIALVAVLLIAGGGVCALVRKLAG